MPLSSRNCHLLFYSSSMQGGSARCSLLPALPAMQVTTTSFQGLHSSTPFLLVVTGALQGILLWVWIKFK
ncbi:hypothetical protein BS50DRAFT_319241 [Corynespora cassiicola Philippines]|uniref:Uncharacterized protein n=1 Tax=Corynespora cassiicola Philippines TaxID=1448308 RepID=A0A2T2NSX8_CORCC|nr:hypothetical protein BS50DRAFT_319241 [Corynespora cassiicola Philippines]